MKTKLVILALLTSLSFASCKKKQCPAYGKVVPKNSVQSKHC